MLCGFTRPPGNNDRGRASKGRVRRARLGPGLGTPADLLGALPADAAPSLVHCPLVLPLPAATRGWVGSYFCSRPSPEASDSSRTKMEQCACSRQAPSDE